MTIPREGSRRGGGKRGRQKGLSSPLWRLLASSDQQATIAHVEWGSSETLRRQPVITRRPPMTGEARSGACRVWCPPIGLQSGDLSQVRVGCRPPSPPRAEPESLRLELERSRTFLIPFHNHNNRDNNSLMQRHLSGAEPLQDGEQRIEQRLVDAGDRDTCRCVRGRVRAREAVRVEMGEDTLDVCGRYVDLVRCKARFERAGRADCCESVSSSRSRVESSDVYHASVIPVHDRSPLVYL